MKDEFGRTFGKKEFFETLIIVIMTLFIVSIAFLIPDLFSLIFLIIVIFLITALFTFWYKRNK